MELSCNRCHRSTKNAQPKRPDESNNFGASLDGKSTLGTYDRKESLGVDEDGQLILKSRTSVVYSMGDFLIYQRSGMKSLQE